MIAKHYVSEWERHSDLYAFPVTTFYDIAGAQVIAKLAAERFGFPMPVVLKNRRRQRSVCHGFPALRTAVCTIELAADFLAGDLLHELAHAWCFHRYGDHDHGSLFVCAMDDLCIWFRAHEEAQMWLFP